MKITLRLPQLSDAETILAWENNPENWDVSDNDSPYSLSDIEELIASFQTFKQPTQLRFIICSDNHLLGAVDLFEINYEIKSAAIGILIADFAFREKGIATEALNLIEIEAKRFNLQRLHASIHIGNTASRRLFEKAGYKFVNTVDHVNEQSDLILVEKWINEE